MDVVAGSGEVTLFNTMWGIWPQPTGLSVEVVLQDHVGAGIIFWRLQHIVLNASDMRHKREAVGWIGCDRVRSDRGFLLVNGSLSLRTRGRSNLRSIRETWPTSRRCAKSRDLIEVIGDCGDEYR